VKRIAETLGVVRSNLIERVGSKRPKRGPQTRTGDYFRYPAPGGRSAWPSY
jgi:hypothetical protein